MYGKEAADILACTYKEAGDITVLPYQPAEVRREQRNIKIPDDLPDLMDSTISMKELNYAMKKLNQKKSPEPDGIRVGKKPAFIRIIQAAGFYRL